MAPWNSSSRSTERSNGSAPAMANCMSKSMGSPARAASLTRRMLRAPSASTLCLGCAGILHPNVLSIGSIILGIGMPPRTSAILAYAAVALIAHLVLWPVGECPDSAKV